MAEKAKDKSLYALAVARISIGLILLWAFFDKLVGLGFTTCRDMKTNVVSTMCDSAWLNGGSPTTGFLKNATKGPFEGIFQALANNTLVDWLFMLGLLGIGMALTFGIAMKAGSYSGVALLLLMWLAVLPPEHHPVIDEHIVYAAVLVALANMKDHKWSLQAQYKKSFLSKYIN